MMQRTTYPDQAEQCRVKATKKQTAYTKHTNNVVAKAGRSKERV